MGKKRFTQNRGSNDYRKRNKCLAISIPSSNVFRYSGCFSAGTKPFSGSLVFSIAAIAEFKSVVSNERLVNCIQMQEPSSQRLSTSSASVCCEKAGNLIKFLLFYVQFLYVKSRHLMHSSYFV